MLFSKIKIPLFGKQNGKINWMFSHPRGLISMEISLSWSFKQKPRYGWGYGELIHSVVMAAAFVSDQAIFENMFLVSHGAP